jgi:hypothetical protein
MLDHWSAFWLGFKKLLIRGSAKWFNWKAMRNNRTMLYITAALIVILISVPVIMWKTAEKPGKNAEVVPSTTSVSTPKVTTQAKTPVKPAAPAIVSLGIAPWGEVYVDGDKKGVSPPLNSLRVAPGKHEIEIRNTTFSPYKKTVNLKAGEHSKIKHKFR